MFQLSRSSGLALGASGEDHLVVFLQNVVHLSHVLAADGLDDVAFVVRGVESGAAASLRLAVQRSAAGQ